MVCFVGMMLSSVSFSLLYQAFHAHETAIFCEKKEQIMRLAEGACAYGIAWYAKAKQKIITELTTSKKKQMVITRTLACKLAGNPVHIRVTYTLKKQLFSIEGAAECGTLRERIVRSYVMEVPPVV